ncbi:beta-1,3-galactosyl-O-glycosyl-glycoprotein beta-1,6-N-acetylglucosaminyltransferase-like [Ostrea edulis]|uniref:beta-1,3-galactosyl-O-glycosyl-glycoprotein beta-1,6-N-acetylglucosaminyltransferase-like n=1 Tax=Ostrea edulis TaxID=37623 RepID=UPI0024AF7290|nr:beta-1,3-galactosyl-O-glycosyl-glycoprotein beta-1,6-N-acetylglucosaminyltransferase-like [Ostrea edulis]
MKRWRNRFLTISAALYVVMFALNQHIIPQNTTLRHRQPMPLRQNKKTYTFETFSAKFSSERFHMTSIFRAHSGPKRIVYDIDCQRIIQGDEHYISAANTTMSNRTYLFPTDREMGNLAQNCGAFLKTFDYESFFVSQEEFDFPIAYTILTYKDVVQTEKLLRAIYRPHNLYCIHVDKTSDNAWVRYAMLSIANCLPNVFLASKSEDVIYAGFSRLKADLNCMSDLLNNVDINWRYVINLPSQEFPLKTNLEIVRILKTFNATSDVDSDYDKNTMYRYNETYTAKDGKLKSTGKKKDPPPYNITVGKGSAYGVFSRDFVNYSINDAKAQGILKWLEDTYSPDESFWATLQFNKHLNVPGVNCAGVPTRKWWIAVYTLWQMVHKDCHGKYVRDICVFGLGDLNRLVSKRELFANKFHHDYQPLALQCMEEWMFNTTFTEVPSEAYYYRILVH